MVDPRQDPISLARQAIESNADAVGRRPFDDEAAVVAASDADRPMRRHLMPAAGMTLRRCDDQGPPERFGCGPQGRQAGSVDPVVIGQEKMHGYGKDVEDGAFEDNRRWRMEDRGWRTLRQTFS